MESILHQLFSGNYDTTPKRSEKQQELCDKLFAELDKAEAAFGDEYLDRLLELSAEQDELRNYQYYRSGFVLGVRLMLEALR